MFKIFYRNLLKESYYKSFKKKTFYKANNYPHVFYVLYVHLNCHMSSLLSVFGLFTRLDISF